MAMNKPIVAVYEGGSFKPVEPVSDIAEHERVYLLIETEKKQRSTSAVKKTDSDKDREKRKNRPLRAI